MRKPNTTHPPAGDGGFALIVTLLTMIVVLALVGATVTLANNHILVNRYQQRADDLTSISEAGLEQARAVLNGNRSLYPDSGYVTIESDAQVPDGSGGYVDGVTRSVYAGPIGITSGQYGIFGSLVSVARDEGGGVAVRRLMVTQESFAKFAYFTDFEPSHISFGGGDQLFGPVHTNDYLKIYSSGATFHSTVTTARTVQGEQYGTFKKGYTEHAPSIAMPETADLDRLENQAIAGGTYFVGDTDGSDGSATTRIEFMAIDLNGDGDETDSNEGFIRVYQSDDWRWLSADVPYGGMDDSENCGDYHGSTFVPADDHPSSGSHHYVDALTSGSRRCYLGGSDELWGGFDADDGEGEWLDWGGAVSPLVSGRDDANHLFPISRDLNAAFKGVIFVEGKVIISGTLRGRVTVAATSDIIIGDDLVYATNPGAGTCEDLLGVFSADDIVVADNTINSPTRPASGYNHYTMDDTKDEFVHGVMLALDIFTVEDYAGGSTNDEACEGSSWGRGCLYLTGGIIQETRGAVGTILSWGGGTGYVKRYSYDKCAATQPPPYFPTTGHFVRGQIYPVDPVGFNAAGYYASYQTN